MKRIIPLLCALTLALCLSACGEEKGGNTQLTNPVSEITAEDMAKELGLKEIRLDGASNLTKIDGEDVIYSMDAPKDGTVYHLRLAWSGSAAEQDISGVYLNGDQCAATVFDSPNAEEDPTVTVEGDGEYTKAYGCWNGRCFSVSTEGAIPPEEMSKTTAAFMKTLLASDNIKEKA